MTVTNVFQIPLATAPLCGRCRRNTRSTCLRCKLPVCDGCIGKVACPRSTPTVACVKGERKVRS